MSGYVGTQHTNTGLLGITTFAPGEVVKSFHRKDVSSGTLAPSNDDTTARAATAAFAFPAISGRHYRIHGMQSISPRGHGANSQARYQNMMMYYGTTNRAINATTLDTSISGGGATIGLVLVADSTVVAPLYLYYSYTGGFTAASTATHYFYTVMVGYANMSVRAYNAADAPHYTNIYEVMP
jgi:hypothetical protein